MEKIVIGIDEAGRGPLAGRVYAAAVVLGNKIIDGLNDSKKLSESKREKMYDIIKKEAVDYQIAYATVEEIDSINILQASHLAMKRALDGIKKDFNYIMVDGNIYPFKECKGEAIIKGDSLIPEIMAASILAKVERDRYMTKLSQTYPQYLFDKHKGYPTKLHKDLIKIHGPCVEHRKTFSGVKEHIK